MVTSLFTPSTSSSILLSTPTHSKSKSTYIPRHTSSISSSSSSLPSPTSPASFGNNVQSSPLLPAPSKNSRAPPFSSRRNNNNHRGHDHHVGLPPPMVSFASSAATDSHMYSASASSSTGGSKSSSSSSGSNSNRSNPSFHSLASLTPSMSPSYTQKIARREKRHFQSPASTYSSSSSSSTAQKSPSGHNSSSKGKGGVTFSSSASQPFLFNRSAPLTATVPVAAQLAVPSSTAKPKDRFLSRSSFSFTALSSKKENYSSLSTANTVPLAAASASTTPTTPEYISAPSSSGKPAPKIAALPSTTSSRNHNNTPRIRASLRNRISTWASSVRQSLTTAHQQHQQHHSSFSPAPSINTPTTSTTSKSSNHSAASSVSQSAPAAQELLSSSLSPSSSSASSTPVPLSSKDATPTTIEMMTPSFSSASPKEAIDGTRPPPTLLYLLPLIQESDDQKQAEKEEQDDEEEDEKLTHRYRHHVRLSVTTTPSQLTPSRSPKLVEPPSQYPAAPVAALLPAQYTPPKDASVSGRPKHNQRNSFSPSQSPSTLTVPKAVVTTTIPVVSTHTAPAAVAAVGTASSPTTATTTATSPTKTFHSSLERAQFMNLNRRRKVGSGLITVFCIAAIVILILC
ncbi:MAG: hypothetical protein J3R72DRAFT_496938 [Linnemannia gamsii]|nr:MAG: hypothetical protein J3R72DRAFT_496938 [Linnemannia gamsii]